MKFVKNFILYAALILFFGGLIFYLLHRGGSLDHSVTAISSVTNSLSVNGRVFTNIFQSNLREALPRLLLQIIIIIAATQLLGSVFKKIGQPAVIGEIVAGILLGPSLLGLLFPSVFHFIFPVESLPNLRFLSQIGLILFMFIVGMELDKQLLRKQAFEALIISHASILIPFSLGIALSFYLYNSYAGAQTHFLFFRIIYGHRDEYNGFSRTGEDHTGQEINGYKTWNSCHHLCRIRRCNGLVPSGTSDCLYKIGIRNEWFCCGGYGCALCIHHAGSG